MRHCRCIFQSIFAAVLLSASRQHLEKKGKHIAPLLPGVLCNLVGQLTDPFRAPLASMAKVSCFVKSSKTFFVGEVGGRILRVGSPLSTYKLIFMNTFKGRLQEIQTLSDMKHIFSGSSGDKNLIKYLVLPRRFSSTQTPTAGGHFSVSPAGIRLILQRWLELIVSFWCNAEST